MSQDDAFTIKEVIKDYMEEMKQTIANLHDKVDGIIVQTTKTNGRVNKLDSVVEEMSAIVKNHDSILLKNTTTADVAEKRSQTLWAIIKWVSIPFFAFLGWVGVLYFEHEQRILVEQTSSQVVQLLEDNYDIHIK